MIALILEYAGLVCVQTHIYKHTNGSQLTRIYALHSCTGQDRKRWGSSYVSSLMQGGQPYFIHDGQPIDGLSC